MTTEKRNPSRWPGIIIAAIGLIGIIASGAQGYGLVVSLIALVIGIVLAIFPI
jgi:hypothetical protein